jgi:hypothetical protein
VTADHLNFGRDSAEYHSVGEVIGSKRFNLIYGGDFDSKGALNTSGPKWGTAGTHDAMEIRFYRGFRRVLLIGEFRALVLRLDDPCRHSSRAKRAEES